MAKKPTKQSERLLIELGEQLDAAWRAERQAIDAPAPKFEAAFHRCSTIVRKILGTRASSIAGLRVKARAVEWCRSGRPRGQLFEGSTTDIRLAGSIVRDLLAL